jgi:hypothetical protein
MVKSKIKNSLKKVVTELKTAETEINRPHEDVVTLSVCLTARQSMSSMMRIFMLSNSINHVDGQSIFNLLDQCKTIDKQFESIDLSKMQCKGMNTSECANKYCLSLQNASDCIAIANQLKLLVMNKLQFSESEID